ncbi:hypothetical protein IID21_02620 [Patescibacteria group bacterium]|nr:hypothetical protein [Patescibacteria group bacterium]
MSKGAKTGLWIWSVVVLVVTGAILYSNLKIRTYSGKEVAFTTSSGWYVDVNTVNPIRIEAADSVYFRIVQGETHLYGVPETPPLDYAGDEYFRLEAQLQEGRWKVADGSSISIELIGEETFSVTHFPTTITVTSDIVVGAVIGLVVLLVGFLIGAVVFDD